MINLKSGIALVSCLAAVGAAFAQPASGLDVGEQISSFHPQHVTGPFKGTDTCPPCVNGDRPQAIVFVNGDSRANIVALARALDRAMQTHARRQFRAYVVVISDAAGMDRNRQMLTNIAREHNLQRVGLALLDRNSDTIREYRLNLASNVRNTVFVYHKWDVKAKFVNLEGNQAGTNRLMAAIRRIAA
ncbi:MAG: hypothetical protein SNJ74_06645 [Fimbriimonadaceae bacterium]